MPRGKYSTPKSSEDGGWLIKNIKTPPECIEERICHTVEYYDVLNDLGVNVPFCLFIDSGDSITIASRKVIPLRVEHKKMPCDEFDQLAYGDAREQDRILLDSLGELMKIVSNSDGALGYDATPTNFVYGSVDGIVGSYLVDIYPPRLGKSGQLLVDYPELAQDKEKERKLRRSFYDPVGILEHFSLWFMVAENAVNYRAIGETSELIVKNTPEPFSSHLDAYLKSDGFSKTLMAKVHKVREWEI